MFSISVSDDLELRSDDDAYTRTLSDSLNILTDTEIVFQQKGLSTFEKNALAHYCRILIVTDQDDSCPYPLSDNKDFTSSDLNDFNAMAEEQLGQGQYFMIDPVTTVETTSSGAVYIRTHYARSGIEGMVFVDICYYCNYDSLVRAIFSYRNSESSLWREHLLNAMRSFSWLNPHVSKKNYASSSYDEAKESDTTPNDSSIIIYVLIAVITILVLYIISNQRKQKGHNNNTNERFKERDDFINSNNSTNKNIYQEESKDSYQNSYGQYSEQQKVYDTGSNNSEADYEEEIIPSKQNEEEGKAGCVGIGFSFLFPFIGIILYFVQKKSVSNPSAYLYAALISFSIGFIMTIISK